MPLRLFLVAATSLLVAPSWSGFVDGAYTAVGHGTDSCSAYVAARLDPPAPEPPSAPEPTTVQQALRLMSQLGMGVGVNPVPRCRWSPEFRTIWIAKTRCSSTKRAR